MTRLRLIDIGGGSYPLGILFISDNHEIEIRTFPKIEIGDVKLSNKSKKDDKHTKIILPLLTGFFVAGELYGHSWVPWNIFRPIVFSIYLGIIIFTYYHYGLKSFDLMRSNHGAEHKAIEAYKNGKIESMGDVIKVSRFNKWCGSGILFPILIMIALGDWIRYPFTLSLIYYLGYLHIAPLRNLFYKIIAKPVQFLTTKEPPIEILEAAKIGLLRLVNEEIKIKANLEEFSKDLVDIIESS